MKQDSIHQRDKSNKINLMIGIIWLFSMILSNIYFIMEDYFKASAAFFVFLIASIVLRYTWFNKEKKHKD